MTGLADRLIAAMRAEESQRPYRLERAELCTVEEGMTWLFWWCGLNGETPWRQADLAGTARREHLARQWLWLRWLHQDQWRDRGGVDT